MLKRVFSVVVFVLLVTSMLTLAFNIQPVKASGTIYIRADGSIDPPTAPISTVDSITYTFTGDINDSIVIERDNIVVDGAGQTLQGSGSGTGISLSGKSNVTIKSANIKNYWYGILPFSSSSSSISGNNITDNSYYGIYLYYSSSSSISGNNITDNNYYGIYLDWSHNNIISGNTFTNSGLYVILDPSWYNSISGNNIAKNGDGIDLLLSSSYNSISGNNITANTLGIYLSYSSGNSVFHNNFINNAQQMYPSDSVNVWDDGYPSGGNYWSDYTGADLYGGPYQNITGSDGIGDTPYVVDANNRDQYPLMTPYIRVHDIAVTNVMPSKTVVGQGYSLDINVTVTNHGDYTETFNVTAYANATIIASQNVTLPAGNSTTVMFTWNTASFGYGNYTLSAYAWPVLGETNTANNNFTGGTVRVTIPGDINADGTVDIYDAIILAGVFGTNTNSMRWNSNADLNSDGNVDIYDAIILAGHFNQHYP